MPRRVLTTYEHLAILTASPLVLLQALKNIQNYEMSPMVLLEKQVPVSDVTASASVRVSRVVINNQAAHRHEGGSGRMGQEKPRGGGEAILP